LIEIMSGFISGPCRIASEPAVFTQLHQARFFDGPAVGDIGIRSIPECRKRDVISICLTKIRIRGGMNA